MPSGSQPRYLGGQAVMEGVMMRGPRTWAVAVRTPEGEIEVVTHDAPTWAEKWAKVPIMRGIMGLGESMSLGFKALAWSADRQIPEEERISSRAMGITMGVALAFFTAIFIIIPAFVNNGVANAFGVEGFWFHLLEGGIRLAIFLGYLFLIGLIKDIKRVYQYHGAEHKAIAAYENDVEVTAESAQRFSTQHVRCGTNFLLTVMAVTIVVYSFVGRPSLPWLIASRIVLIPVVAGLAYEVIRFAAGHMQWAWVRVLMKPGLLLQKLTTREPSLDQVEVAVASLRAVLTAEQLAEVEARATRPSQAPAPGSRPAYGTA
ncbi:MAG: DUF1385 domain-containing protein [Actinobacteria bacterium]|nr:DUF1385 domain-containing protein [Actinomycetota bacterium]